MTTACAAYIEQRAKGKRARDFYNVPCSFCGAAINQACCQLSHLKGTGRRIYFPPHSVRIKDSNRSVK